MKKLDLTILYLYLRGLNSSRHLHTRCMCNRLAVILAINHTLFYKTCEKAYRYDPQAARWEYYENN